MLDILLIILILSAICFCIFGIIYLKKIFEHVEAVRKDVHHFVENSIPVLNILEDITRSAGRIAAGVEGYWVELEQLIRTTRFKIIDNRPWKKFKDAEMLILYFIPFIKSISKSIQAKFTKQ